MDHFKEKGWHDTEMQLFFGGKNTHRIDYGVNMWWTTDEPMHWDDWMALHFFTSLWTEGRKKLRASLDLWPARADISRPQWQGDFLKGVVDVVYYGGFTDPVQIKRSRIIADNSGMKIRAYGSAGDHDQSNIITFLKVLNVWLNGADAFLPWQTIGMTNHWIFRRAVQVMLCLFQEGVLALVWLGIFVSRRSGMMNSSGLTRDQVRYFVHGALPESAVRDNQIIWMTSEQICELKRVLLVCIEKKSHGVASNIGHFF